MQRFALLQPDHTEEQRVRVASLI